MTDSAHLVGRNQRADSLIDSQSMGQSTQTPVRLTPLHRHQRQKATEHWKPGWCHVLKWYFYIFVKSNVIKISVVLLHLSRVCEKM